mmetsp:Transcript_13171/g.39231  ORF Transcript_13171/g.39231 Transcript_13171/m.39231 type:complete len:185 (+) Transcript_13171:199-753(+)
MAEAEPEDAQKQYMSKIKDAAIKQAEACLEQAAAAAEALGQPPLVFNWKSGSTHLKPKKPKKKVDPEAPKRAPSGYQLYMAEMKATMPELGGKGFMAKMGALWRELPEDQKKAYNEKAAPGLKQFSEDMAAYKSGKKEEAAAPAEAPPTKKKKRKAEDGDAAQSEKKKKKKKKKKDRESAATAA